MSSSYVRKCDVRVGRLLTLAGVIAAIVGLWPAAAQANIRCFSQRYIVCDRIECCFVTCVICVDADGNVVGSDCQATSCVDKQF
jgi:hypothetical protein